MEHKKLTVEIHSLKVSKRGKQKLLESIDYLEKAVNHPEFNRQVLSHSYVKDGKTVKGYHGCEMTPEKIYALIMSGEDLFSGPDGDIDIRWKVKKSPFWKRNSATIGYTYSHSSPIVTYEWFIEQHYPMTIAGHLMHEYLHNCGFKHERRRTELRRFSVPYAIGNVVKHIAWDFSRGRLPEEG